MAMLIGYAITFICGLLVGYFQRGATGPQDSVSLDAKAARVIALAREVAVQASPFNIGRLSAALEALDAC